MALSFFMVINTVFEKINQQKNHKYYYLSPHVYAVGNCSEEIYYGLIKARLLKKKLIILYPFDILFIFRYKLQIVIYFHWSQITFIAQVC